MLRFLILKRLKKSVYTYDDLKQSLHISSDVKLYRALQSLIADEYIEEFNEEAFKGSTFYKNSNINSLRNYKKATLTFLLNVIAAIGGVTALVTLLIA